MKIMKKFLEFVNESTGNIDLMLKNIQIAYNNEKVFFSHEDKDAYFFYVLDSDFDEASIASGVLEDPGVFGDFVSFEMEDATVKLYNELKDLGVEISGTPEHVVKVRIAKKHPTGRYTN